MSHQKSIPAPKALNISRKEHTFTTRARPGAHTHTLAIPLATWLRANGFCTTRREIAAILAKKMITINGRIITDHKYGLGLLDVISIPTIKKQWRIVLDAHKQLTSLSIPSTEATILVCTIINKRKIHAGKFQLNLSGGRNILWTEKTMLSKEIASIILEVPTQKIIATLPFANGTTVYLVNGKHAGKTGTITTSSPHSLTLRSGNHELTTLKKFAIPISREKEKHLITVQ